MKKTLIICLLILVVSLSFSFTLGIKCAYEKVNISEYAKGVRILEVLNNSLASRFLKSGDIIIAAKAAYFTIALPGVQMTSRNPNPEIDSDYISKPRKKDYTPITSIDEFKKYVSCIGEAGTWITFIVYRNGNYISYCLR